jgi:hypothetical protein
VTLILWVERLIKICRDSHIWKSALFVYLKFKQVIQ